MPKQTCMEWMADQPYLTSRIRSYLTLCCVNLDILCMLTIKFCLINLVTDFKWKAKIFIVRNQPQEQGILFYSKICLSKLKNINIRLYFDLKIFFFQFIFKIFNFCIRIDCFLYCQLSILLTWHFFSLPFQQLAILPTCHFDNSPFAHLSLCHFAISSVSHFVNIPIHH